MSLNFNFFQDRNDEFVLFIEGCSKMKVAIMTSLSTEGDVDVDAGHGLQT